ncbi:PTS glucose transporter subunit IIA [Priestia megaterium]|uniref:PTS sugar transporter subunit IIA n=1 Tax=Priestia megaterium TaxID=1404 RepID=UPI002FE2780B
MPQTNVKAEVAATAEIAGTNYTISESAFILPFDGYVMPLEDVPDAVFSSKMMGDGFAIEPTNNTLVSPINGEVVSIFPTKHAIGLKTDEGLEILIHVGIETVALKGQGFTCLVEDGQKIKQGTPLLKLELDYIKENAKSIITPVIFTNLPKETKVELNKTGYFDQGTNNIITL